MSAGNIKCIAHAAFKCKNVEETVNFYTKCLGCTVKFTLTYKEWLAHLNKQEAETGVPTDPGYKKSVEALAAADQTWITYIDLGNDQFIELFHPEGTTEHGLTDGRLNFQHLAIEVDDIHAFTEKIRANGAPIDIEPSFGLEHTWQMWSHDPDGNKIEFMQYSERSFQLVGKN